MTQSTAALHEKARRFPSPAVVRDVPRLYAAQPLGPLAAKLHTLAAHITAHNLPVGDLAIFDGTILVDLSVSGLPENAIRRWAASIHTPVISEPDGTYLVFTASGITETGLWLNLTAKVAVTA